ncbi:adenylyl cyclase [Sphingomonas sp. QA11]|uniref:adenylyl cyclase n=1 Tax=Sphingomonas sp. QA11 TaxID=2950605 RepID=UPI00234AA1B7|nr:adenylyl cyclase [Sphingomonas sp. QA11]WCM25106.1 adenylyl cyclase [Sphingomonas sp. QA11]
MDAFQPTRRSVVAGLSGAAVAAVTAGAAARPARSPNPDLGPNVLIADPSMPRAVLQQRVDAIFRSMERAHFTDARHAILFKPGRYDVDVNVGFFTQVAGLGAMPGDVVIEGHVHAEADWAKGMALVNFWRGVENLEVRPPDGADRWAVSQAAPYRRVHLGGDLALDDGGWSSGGFIADCRIDGTIRSGSQQQWFTRNSEIRGWNGANWNMMFMGVDGAPAASFPEPPYTTISAVPVIRDKPFLHIDATGEWKVFVPALRRTARGVSWGDRKPQGSSIPLSRFFIGRPDMPARQINAALALGRNLLLTPGIYHLDTPLRIDRADTVVLGLGLATLLAEGSSKAIVVADVPGVTIAGLMIDAGPMLSPVLVEIGPRGTMRDHRANPTLLSDLFFRVGGASIGNAETCLEINSHHVIGDHLWIWRADHGDRARGRVHVGWDESVGNQGLVVNGDDVTMCALFVEHFRRYNTLWNGERGRTWFYQNELPYDPPSQSAYMAGTTRGWAAYKVADGVDDHEAVALGIYANFTADPGIVVESAIEAPRKPGIRFSSVTTISLGGGKGTIAHLVNEAGAAARPGAIRQTLVTYPPHP